MSRRRIRILPSDPDIVRALLATAGRERFKGTMDGHDVARRLEQEAVRLRGELVRRARRARRATAARRDHLDHLPSLHADDLDPTYVAGRWPPR